MSRATLEKFDAIVIAGPTASGKSAAAVVLARALNGVVINADSMQVYRDLHVLTARPTPEEEGGIPHHLFGHVDGAVNYSVGYYLKDATAAIADAWQAGKLPVIAGGTGLYFKALVEGLSDIPPVPEEVRAAVRALAETLSAEALHAHLAVRDAAGAARLNPADSPRVQRALEVVEATGKSLASFHDNRTPGPLVGKRLKKLFLDADRDLLRSRINARFEKMMAEGALDEVRALHARRLDPLLPVMRAHGVPGLIDYLEGRVSLEDAITRGQADTRRYAKRQFTWFRHQLEGWDWVKPADAVEAVLGRPA